METAKQMEASRATRRGLWIGLAGLLIAEAMNLLDSTITTVAAPLIREELQGTTSMVQWVAAGYTLPFAVSLIPGGRLGDIFGRRRIFLIGLVSFVLASIGCACAPTMPILLSFRLVQGLGAGLVIPQTIGLVKAMFTGRELGKALSFIGPVMGLTAVAGPMLGGFLTHADLFGLSWRVVFLVNLPLAAIVLMTMRSVPEDRPDRRPSLDIAGTLLVGCAASGLTIPIVNTTISGPAKAGLFALAAVAMATLVLHVRRLTFNGKDPVVEPSLFRDRGFPAALVTSILYFGVATGLVFVVVLYVQGGLGLSVLTSSLIVLPFSAGLAVASLIAGQKLVPRIGPKLMFVGVGFLAVGALIGTLSIGLHSAATFPTAWLPISLGIAGIGGGLLTVPFFTAAISRVNSHEVGSAAGLLNSVQQLGGTLGIVGLGGLYVHAPAPGHGLTVVLAACVVVATALGLSVRTMLQPKRSVR